MIVYMHNKEFKADNLTKAHIDDAGHDIKSAEDVTIQPWQAMLVKTGLHIDMDWPLYGLLVSRSGMMIRHNVEAATAVIDSGYQGEVQVLLRNHSDSAYEVKKGDRIAQMVFHALPSVTVVEEDIDVWDKTVRGSEGMGSTGT